MFTDRERGIPGGETPPSTAGGTPAATELPMLPDSPLANPRSRFMENEVGGGGGVSRPRIPGEDWLRGVAGLDSAR
jgi:hypothetical protein